MAKRQKSSRVPLPTEDPEQGSLAAGLAALGFTGRPITSEASKTTTPAAGWSFGPKAVLRKERKGRGGRTVTVVSGAHGDLAGLAARLKKGLGCGATVEQDTIVLQGDIAARAEPLLRDLGARKVVHGT